MSCRILYGQSEGEAWYGVEVDNEGTGGRALANCEDVGRCIASLGTPVSSSSVLSDAFRNSRRMDFEAYLFETQGISVPQSRFDQGPTMRSLYLHAARRVRGGCYLTRYT
jgi:hypothetical protein